MIDRLVLFDYRLRQAEITLDDAKKMIQADVSARSIINRAYYSMFYMVLPLFLKMNVATKTSKHSGVIALFDREFVLTGKIEKKYSKMFHSMFDDRQEFDYKEFDDATPADAERSIAIATEFVNAVKNFIIRSE